MRYTLIVFFYSLGLGFVCGQDSVGVSKVPSNAEYARLQRGVLVNSKIDSSLNEFHLFYPNYRSFEQSNGNFGLPIVALEYKWDKDWEIILNNPYKGYREGLVGNIVSDRPYTKLFYSNGTNQEQYFNLQHSQRIRKGWNITAELDKVNSSGFYSNQKSDNTLAQVSSLFRSRSGRFVQMTAYNLERYTNKENGGLFDYSEFENDESDKAYLDVSLNDASNILRTHKLSTFNALKIAGGDSAKDGRGFHLVVKGSASDSRFLYNDENTNSLSYLLYGLNEGSKAYDSLNVHYLNGEIGLQNFSPLQGIQGFSYGVFGGYDYYLTYHNYKGKTIENVYGAGNFGFAKEDFSSIARGKYYYAGYRLNDYEISAKGSIKLDSLLDSKVSLWIRSDAKMPNYQFENYTGLANWSYEFDKTYRTEFGLTAASNDIHTRLEASFKSIKNILYVDSTYSVQQYTGTTNLFSVQLDQQINIKKFHFDGRFLFQQPIGEDYFRVPQFVGFASVYFESYLFKKATLFRAGVDTYYATAYYGNGYLPLYRSFYIQDSKLIGNYPFFDVFVAAQIKKARVFAKVTHVNSGFMGNTYYASYNYPMADRMIRLGVDWAFWD